MAWTHASREPNSARWSCRRCYTMNAFGAQFCSDCGLAPRPATMAAAPPPIDSSRRRLVVVPVTFFAVLALGFVGLQFIR
jgi:membrane protease subunit (stomatin/prohibitin family)